MATYIPVGVMLGPERALMFTFEKYHPASLFLGSSLLHLRSFPKAHALNGNLLLVS